MSMIRWGRFFALVSCLLMLALPAPAAESDSAGGDAVPIELEAEELTFDQASGTYLAERDVLLRRGEQILQADEVRWDARTSQADAFGDVYLTGPEGTATGDEMHLNMEKEVGLIRNGRIFVRKPNVHILGTEIEKTGERTYRVEDGTFTTCDGEVPSWKFTASELDVTVDGFAWARHAVFHIYDIPVIYLPIFGYPVVTERESGFLMPNAGYSDSRGTQLSLAYYQVMGRNMDATFYLDYLSRLGLGKGAELRYFLGHDNRGEAIAYHVSGFSGMDDRFALDWRHLGTLPGDVRLIADVLYISERDYFSDFGEVAGEYNRDQAESLIAASRNWEKNNLAGQVRYVKNLVGDDDLTLQRLPEIRFAMLRHRIGDTPFYYRMDTGAAYLYQDQDLEGGRFSLRPALSAVFRPGGVLDFVSEVAYLERYYTGSFGEEREGVFDFSTRLATRFGRVYPVNGKRVRKIQHVVQPEIAYRYVPADDSSDLPLFEAQDRIGRQNLITCGITNRFIARLESPEGQVAYHEFLYLRLAQEINLEASGQNLLVGEEEEEDGSTDNLRLELILRPTQRTFFDIDTRYDVSSGEDFLDFNAATGLRDERGNSLALSYRYHNDEQEYLGAQIGTSLMKPVYVNYQHRYSIDGSNALEKVLDLEYRAQCWSFFLTWRDRQDEQEITFNFALTGLGRTSHPGSRVGRYGEEL
jgi:LPS-assembly protein